MRLLEELILNRQVETYALSWAVQSDTRADVLLKQGANEPNEGFSKAAQHSTVSEVVSRDSRFNLGRFGSFNGLQ